MVPLVLSAGLRGPAVTLDHYIPQCVTRDWEYGKRRFRAFDFRTGAFDEPYAKPFFAEYGLNGKLVEDMLNRLIENPVGKYLDRGRQLGRLPEPSSKRVVRALTLLFLLNSQRIDEARDEWSHELTLEKLERLGDNYLNALADAAQSRLVFR